MDSYTNTQSEDNDKKMINGLSLLAISDQVVEEYNLGEQHVRSWREQKRLFLKLYINQRKNPKKVGDALMFSTHQTILAALYRDVLDAEWGPRDEDDVDQGRDAQCLLAI